MYVHIIDYHGILDWFKVVETGKVPEGFEYKQKVSVAFINSVGDRERSLANHNHIQIRQIADVNLHRYLRDIRIEHNELLKDMADKLGMGSAELSAIEHGKKELPADFMRKLRSLYMTGA